MPHLMADVRWALTRAYLAGSKYLLLPWKELPSQSPARFAKVLRRRGAMVPMRDGIRLRADVYLPDDGEASASPRPAMLIRMPYGIREAYAYMPAVARYWARRGYAAVVQDVRGKFGSEGEWRPFAHEVDDGYDTIEWVARQNWCDGRVAMTGESYYAFTQWAAAASRHPALVSIAPGDMGLDLHTLLYEGGALCLSSTALWICDQAGHGYLNWYRFNTRHLPVRDMAEAAGYPSPLFRDAADHQARSALWDEHDYRRLLDLVEVPVLVWSGWYDNLLGGTLQVWLELERRRPDLRQRRRLVIGPTDHETSADFDLTAGRVAIPAGPRSWDRVLEFTDEVLAGGTGAALAGPRVRCYVTGAGHWHESDAWPAGPGAGELRLYLRAGGGLTPVEPDPGEEPSAFGYDPADPAGYWEGRDLWAMTRNLADRRPLHKRHDVLLYRTDPLPEPVDLLGDVTVAITVATTATDADVTVALVDIFPDGHAQLVREGILRLSHRDPAMAPAPVEPGQACQVTVGLGALGYRFAAGHRIAVEISGSSFDRWDRNLHPGTTTIYHQAGRASRIGLPVIGASA